MIDDGELRQAYDELLRTRGPRDRVACPSPESLLALVEREGAEDERMRTLDHVMSCAACRRDFDLLRTATDSATRALTELGDVQPIGTRRHLPWRPLAVAAGLVVAVGIGVVSRDMRTTTPPLLRGSEHMVPLLGPDSRTDGTLLLRWRRRPRRDALPRGAVHAVGPHGGRRDPRRFVVRRAARGTWRWGFVAVDGHRDSRRRG